MGLEMEAKHRVMVPVDNLVPLTDGLKTYYVAYPTHLSPAVVALLVFLFFLPAFPLLAFSYVAFSPRV